MAKTKVYCDHCASDVTDVKSQNWYGEIPWSIDSANIGESAVICSPCRHLLESRATKELQ